MYVAYDLKTREELAEGDSIREVEEQIRAEYGHDMPYYYIDSFDTGEEYRRPHYAEDWN